jgi:hypothetical protein
MRDERLTFKSGVILLFCGGEFAESNILIFCAFLLACSTAALFCGMRARVLCH